MPRATPTTTPDACAIVARRGGTASSAPTRDECIALAEQVARGSFHRLPLLAQALLHHLCDDIPPNASAHEATEHIAMRGVDILRHLPSEPATSCDTRGYLVLAAALCGVGLAFRVASAAVALVAIARWAGVRGVRLRALTAGAVGWLAWLAWRATGLHRLDVFVGAVGLVTTL